MWWKQFKTLKIQFSPPFCSQEKIKSSVKIFCIFRYFIAKINDKHSILLFFVHWKTLFCYIFLHKLIFSLSIIYCTSIVNYFTITFLSPEAGPGWLSLQGSTWSLLCDQNTPTRNCRQRSHLISRRKRLNRKNLISEDLGRKIMTPHSSTRLNFSFNPGIIQLNHYLWEMRFSSFSDPRNQQVSLSDV